MALIAEKISLRVYLQSADRPPRAPTYERLVEAARKDGLAGATVIQGILGYGYHGFTRPGKLLSLVEHLPIIVEIVDEPDKIAAFVSTSLAHTMAGGMATLKRTSRITLGGTEHDQAPTPIFPGAQPALSTVLKIQMRPNMTMNENSVLLRVFIGESDSYDHKPLHEQIIQKVRALGLAGATVLRGVEGFGANSVVHRAHLLDMSTDLPMVVEIVESEEKIKLLLPSLKEMIKDGMVTMEQVVILMYRHDPADAPPAGAA